MPKTARKPHRTPARARARGKTYTGEDLTGYTALQGTVVWKKSNEIWRTYQTHEYEEMAAKHSIIFACLNRIYTAAQEAELQIGVYRGNKFQPTDDHPSLAVLEKPNALMSWADFVAQIIIHLLVTGETYYWKINREAGLPVELWPLPTSWVTKLLDKTDSNVIAYRMFQGTKQTKTIPAVDMGFGYMPDPQNPKSGSGPLQAMLHDEQLDEERENYLAEMLINMKFPGMVVHSGTELTPKQKDEARAVLASRVGYGKRGNPIFLAGKESSIELQAPLKDLDWPGLSNLCESRICAAFGISPMLVHVRAASDMATYANYEQAEKSFYGTTMVALWRVLEEYLTRTLLRDEGNEENWFRFDLSMVKQLQDTSLVTAQRAQTLFAASIVTRNEAREMTGLPSLPKPIGDVFLTNISNILVPLNELNATPVPPPSTENPPGGWNPEEEEEEEPEE